MTLIKDMQVNHNFEGFYLIKSVELKQTRAGKDYLQMVFQDRSGTIGGNLWDAQQHNIDTFTAGKVVHAEGKREVYNNMPQVNQLKLRLPEYGEPSQPSDFREKSPVNEKELRDYVTSVVFKIENATWNRIVRVLLKKFDKEFYEFPAAKSNHHAFEGGLAFHETTMLRLAEKICEVYPELNSSLMYAGILLHDLAKCLEFTGFENTNYTLKGNLIGHIVLIDEEITKTVVELGLDEDSEDVLLLRHVVLSHHGELDYGSPVRPQIMEAEMIHQIDMMDANMMMMMTALAPIDKGQQTARIWPLDNRNFYKPSFTE
ncbi:MAG: 3'-5' exoribonuclease YhaM family protein [Streptococcaceae bacterium]|jgi:3'-5' exoribonuclease|nr:3'-5' exoribonuclease YhaM family protein [Streptococcaceae bacterium]